MKGKLHQKQHKSDTEIPETNGVSVNNLDQMGIY
jgi:hypothetical protein